ncbi:hypothetical protein [Microbacterium yannicii]|nr:hypothetical protein [Microbacterium yannicii]
MTEQDHSFGKALFGRRWKSITPVFGWARRAWRRALTSARDSGR